MKRRWIVRSARGMVREGSVKREGETLKVQFVVTDFAADVTVEYDGILPDLFREEMAWLPLVS